MLLSVKAKCDDCKNTIDLAIMEFEQNVINGPVSIIVEYARPTELGWDVHAIADYCKCPEHNEAWKNRER